MLGYLWKETCFKILGQATEEEIGVHWHEIFGVDSQILHDKATKAGTKKPSV